MKVFFLPQYILLGEGNGNSLQYSCLENPMDRGAWYATVYGVTRDGHDLATKPPPNFTSILPETYIHFTLPSARHALIALW